MPARPSIPPRSVSSSTEPDNQPLELAEQGNDHLADEITPGSRHNSSVHKPSQRTINRPMIIESDDNGTPALSSNGSDDNDRSSDYDPSLQTPSKLGKGNINSLYAFDNDNDDDDDDDDEIKPDMSDDEISYPGIVADAHREESEDDDNGGKRSRSKGKGKAKRSAGPTTPKKRKIGSDSIGGSGKKPGVGWTAEEDWMLFQKMHPRTSPGWQVVADAVQRDAKVSVARKWVS